MSYCFSSKINQDRGCGTAGSLYAAHPCAVRITDVWRLRKEERLAAEGALQVPDSSLERLIISVWLWSNFYILFTINLQVPARIKYMTAAPSPAPVRADFEATGPSASTATPIPRRPSTQPVRRWASGPRDTRESLRLRTSAASPARENTP